MKGNPIVIRAELIKAGIVRENSAPTLAKVCVRCKADFQTLLQDPARMCGNCQHPRRRARERV